MPDKIAKRRWAPVITPAARPYLKIQQGRINDFDGAAWDRAYADQLHATADQLAYWLPNPLTSILDIGGGMGGIDALLAAEHGAGEETRVTVLDGTDDQPVVVKPDQTYSNGPTALEFLRANGVPRSSILVYKPGDAISADVAPTFDLVLSLQAWCFHFEPRLYCKLAMAVSRPGTRWILDVRAGNAPWAAYLFATPKLRPLDEVPGFTDKYTRMIFEVEE